MRHNKVFIGSDHGGVLLKQEMCSFLLANGYPVEDIGTHNGNAVDYPDIALDLTEKVIAEAPDVKGILICGSGIGMSIAANKVKSIRAALCSEPLSAKLAREHNDANVLCLGARLIGTEMAKAIISAFLATDFAGQHHERRIQKIKTIEEKEDVE